MEALLQELIPHAPHLGLYVAPAIPEGLERAARKAYGDGFAEATVALYDATRFGSGKSGALFGAHQFIFQNLVETPQQVAYSDLIRVGAEKTLLGGRKLKLSVNRARATFELEMDFSARTEALSYVQRFLETAIARGSDLEAAGASDPVERALSLLEQNAGRLTEAQRARLEALWRP